MLYTCPCLPTPHRMCIALMPYGDGLELRCTWCKKPVTPAEEVKPLMRDSRHPKTQRLEARCKVSKTKKAGQS